MYMPAKIRSFLISFATVCGILGVSLAVIAYGRGYRLNINKGDFRSTGLISATSDPIGAQVFVNGTLQSATNNSFNLDPNWYTVTIAKEGYIPWQKQLRVQGEIVARADAFLFPTAPSLSPLTTLGVQNPLLSPDGTKVAYVIPADHLDNGLSKKAGLWTYELSEGPLGRNRDAIQLTTIDSSFGLTEATLSWSPDSTQVLAQTPTASRLYDLSEAGTFTDVTARKTALLTEWEEERQTKELQKLEGFKQPIIDLATTSARILSLSPDETKILYEATAPATIPEVITPPLIGTNSMTEQRTIVAGNVYVYDSKEDKNFLILEKAEIPANKVTPTPTRRLAQPTPTKGPVLPATSPLSTFIHWFPTSRHIVLTLPGKIDVMEYDRTNWVTIYSGPLSDGFIAPWSNGSRIIILTNLNPGISKLPNLYSVNLR
jgi:hypothetical protein